MVTVNYKDAFEKIHSVIQDQKKSVTVVNLKNWFHCNTPTCSKILEEFFKKYPQVNGKPLELLHFHSSSNGEHDTMIDLIPHTELGKSEKPVQSSFVYGISPQRGECEPHEFQVWKSDFGQKLKPNEPKKESSVSSTDVPKTDTGGGQKRQAKEIDKVDSKKRSPNKKNKSATQTSKSTPKKDSDRAKRLQSFFASATKIRPQTKTSQSESTETSPTSSVGASKSNSSQTHHISPQSESSGNKNSSKKSAGKSHKKPARQSVSKGRKRILVMDSDSSDDDIFASDSEKEETHPEPEVLPIKESQKENTSHKKIKLTTVKTYMSDDGYMVTRKEKEEVVVENVEMPKERKPTPPTPKKTNNGAGQKKEENTAGSTAQGSKKKTAGKKRGGSSGNQLSITGFFSKK